MATNQELFQIILQVQGKQEADDLRAKISLTEQKIAGLWATMKNNPAAFQAAIKADAERLADLQKQLELTNRSIQQAGMTSKQTGQLMTQVGYAADDIQYGFKGIANNIQPILQSIPALSNWAGVISIAVIAVYQLYNHWDQISQLWGQGATKTQAQQMEELGKKTEKTAQETEKLAKYEEMRKRIAAQGAKPDAVTKREAAVDKAISEAGIDDVNKGLDKHFGNLIRLQAEVSEPGVMKELQDAKDARDSAMKRQVGMNKASPGSGDTLVAESLERVSKAQDAANQAYADARSKFSTDPAKTLQIQKAAQANPNDFGPKGEELAKGLDDALNPQKAQLRKIAKVAGEQFGEFMTKLRKEAAEEAEKQAKAGTAKAKADAKKTVADLNKEAKANEKIWDDSVKAATKSKSFVGKADSKLTPAEREAKRVFDAQEQGVTKAMAGQTWLGKEDEALTPEEKIGRKRFEQRQRDADENYRNVKEANPEVSELIKNGLRGAVEIGGMGLAQAQNDLFARLKDTFGEDVTRRLVKEGGLDARQEGISAYLNRPGYQSENASVINGASSLRDTIQGSVKSPELDELQKLNTKFERSLETLNIIARKPGGLG